MAEDEDESSKTEDPSGRKLERGRRRGQVAQSPEVANWGILMAGAALVLFAAPWSMKGIARISLTFLESAGEMPADISHLHRLTVDLAWALLAALWPVFLLLVVAALAIHIVQTGLVWATERFELDWSRLSPLKGLQRLLSLRSLVEFVKGVAKLAIIGGIIFAFALPLLKGAELLPAMSLGAVLDRSEAVVLRVAAAALAVLTVIAGFDFLYQRFAFMKQMRMTKHEVKEEYKQVEGDPDKLKLFCEMSDVAEAQGDKEDAAADASIDGYLEQLGPDFEAAWETGEEADENSPDGKLLDAALDALGDKCPE